MEILVRVLTIIATYNEADNIARLIPAIRDACPETDILVVDDASPDGTTAIVEQLARAAGSRVEVISRRRTSEATGLRSCAVSR